MDVVPRGLDFISMHMAMADTETRSGSPLVAEQSLPPYGEPAAHQLLTHLSRRGFPYGSPPVKRDVRMGEAL